MNCLPRNGCERQVGARWYFEVQVGGTTKLHYVRVKKSNGRDGIAKTTYVQPCRTSCRDPGNAFHICFPDSVKWQQFLPVVHPTLMPAPHRLHQDLHTHHLPPSEITVRWTTTSICSRRRCFRHQTGSDLKPEKSTKDAAASKGLSKSWAGVRAGVSLSRSVRSRILPHGGHSGTEGGLE